MGARIEPTAQTGTALATITDRYLTRDDRLIASLLQPYFVDHRIPGANAGSAIPDYVDATANPARLSDDENCAAIGLRTLSAGSTASVGYHSAIDHDYYDFDNAITSSYRSASLGFVPDDTDCTVVVAVRPSTMDTNVWIGEDAASSGERFQLYNTANGTVSANTINTGADQIDTATGFVAADTLKIIWFSYDHSSKAVAIGSGASVTPSVTGTFSGNLMRAGSGFALGSANGAQPASGRLYRSWVLNKPYDQMTDELGNDVFALALAALQRRLGLS